MNITIIGAGNAGCAHAFKLSQSGQNVSLLKTSYAMHDDNFEVIQSNGGIWCIDHTQQDEKSFQKVSLITRDWEKALKDAEVVMVQVQSNQHPHIAEELSKFELRKLKIIVIIPGNLGSVYFKQSLKNNKILIAEGESTPYDARIIEPGVINILYKNTRNAIAITPRNRKEEGMGIITQLFDTYGYYRTNILESALHNPNLVVHTIGTIMSASRIEATNGEFWLYREAFTPSIWNLVKLLDNEKNEVIKFARGIPMSYLDACKFRNEPDLSRDSLEVFKDYARDGGPKGPSTIYSRYIFEDVPIGLVLLSSFAKKFGIPTPISDSLINIASGLVSTNFWQIGRTLNNLNLDHLSANELVEYVNE